MRKDGVAMLQTGIPTLDMLLDAHAEVLGNDRTAYENHAYRVANLCVALASPAPGPDGLEKIAIAAALHDIGIWTAGTFDYLDPSIEVARAHLEGIGRTAWVEEVEAMIREHHKVSSHRDRPDWLVEPFRRADWVDVTRGLRRFGLPRPFLRQVYGRWPGAGFHRKLVVLTLRRLRTHPWSPIPVLRL